MSHLKFERKFLPSQERTSQLGLTLVEIMVAIVLGLILTAGAIQVFLSNRATYAFNENLSRTQENSRFALQLIAETARMGGYTGCMANVGIFNNLATADSFRDEIAIGLQGFEYDGTGPGDTFVSPATFPAPLSNAASWTPSLPDELTAPARVIPGSDVLVVRHMSADSVPLITPFSDGDKIYAAPTSSFGQGEVLVVSDCQKASIFQVTGVTTNATTVQLSHGEGMGMTPGNSPGTWPTEQSFGLGSEVGRLDVNAFYVGRGERGSPALFRLRLQRTGASTSTFEAEEIVDGIETMQVRYGLDTNQDRQIDAWQTADTVAASNNWDSVVSAEITLLARADDEYGMEASEAGFDVGGMRFEPQSDRRFRRVFSTTIGLRNRLP